MKQSKNKKVLGLNKQVIVNLDQKYIITDSDQLQNVKGGNGTTTLFSEVGSTCISTFPV